jgi:hypothetical protein
MFPVCVHDGVVREFPPLGQEQLCVELDWYDGFVHMIPWQFRLHCGAPRFVLPFGHEQVYPEPAADCADASCAPQVAWQVGVVRLLAPLGQEQIWFALF